MAFTLALTIQVRISKETVGALLARRVGALNPAKAEAAARRVLTATVLREYRKVLLAALPQLLTPKLGRAHATVTQVKLNLKEREAYLDLLTQRDAAVFAGATSKVRQLDRSIQRAQTSIRQRVERVSSTWGNKGEYRRRLFQVFGLLTAPENLAFWWVGDSLYYGIGAIAALKTVRTPSADRKRTYPKALLWKQLEYGAGVHYTGPGSKRTDWTFGGLGVLGIHGVGHLKVLQAQVKNPNEPWQLQLREAVLGAVLTG